MPVTIDELVIADSPGAWESAGFTVEGDVCRVGTVRLRLVGDGTAGGIVSWSLRDVAPTTSELDGIPTRQSEVAPLGPGTHALGVTHVDHVVVSSPDLVRTEEAFEALGVPARRHRDTELGGAPLRQVFFRLGEVIVEVIGSPDARGEGPAAFWGLTFAVAEIDAAAAFLGERTGRVKDAVQPGRRITTLRHRELGLSVATALISLPPT